MIILLDNGHGEETPGKSAGDLQEWRFTRNVVKYISCELKHLRIPHYVLVCEDHDVSLKQRTNRADEAALKHKEETSEGAILLSVHGNAFKDESANGIETWYYSKGKKMAQVFQDELVKELEWKDRGIKRGEFWIIRKSSMPAVLTESGFYTNPEQREEMLTPKCQRRIAKAHVSAIKKIINDK